MKKILILMVITGMIFSCSPSNTTETKKPEASNNETDSNETQANSEEVDDEQLSEINSDEALIATALMAAPAESRAGCTVIGFNMAGEFVTLKEGDNEFICLADDPKREGFSAACYHQDLEPFMARGRALRAEGKNGQEIFDIREEEVKSGKLKMGEAGSTLHIYFGKEAKYNPETSEVGGAKYRYVVYMPFATSETTGLPEKPIAPNHPWIMDPGTHKAHIMITPINEKN